MPVCVLIGDGDQPFERALAFGGMLADVVRHGLVHARLILTDLLWSRKGAEHSFVFPYADFRFPKPL